MEADSPDSILISLVAEAAGVPVEKITAATDLNTDLGLDSLEFVELMQSVCERVKKIPESEWAQFDTVGDLLKAVA